MDIDKLIKIIDSCINIEQFVTIQVYIDNLHFDTLEECKKIKECLIKKEKQFNINPQ